MLAHTSSPGDWMCASMKAAARVARGGFPRREADRNGADEIGEGGGEAHERGRVAYEHRPDDNAPLYGRVRGRISR